MSEEAGQYHVPGNSDKAREPDSELNFRCNSADVERWKSSAEKSQLKLEQWIVENLNKAAKTQ